MPYFKITAQLSYRGTETMTRKIEAESAKEAERIFEESGFEHDIALYNVDCDIDSIRTEEDDVMPRCKLTKELF